VKLLWEVIFVAEMEICRYCSHDVKLAVSDDIGFRFHWIGDHYVFDVVLLIEEADLVLYLYREVYILVR
jgi:hypothetical protein